MANTDGKSKTAAKKRDRLRRDLIQQLLTQCTAVGPLSDSDLQCIFNLTQQLLIVEKGLSKVCRSEDRTNEKFRVLLQFCQDNGVDTSKISVQPIEDRPNDFGLSAVGDILENDLILSIPRSLVLTSENSDSLPSLTTLKGDPLLTEMPNLLLVMSLIHELSLGDDSFWKPYIDCLPTSYSTPLYLDWESFQRLKPSPTHQEAGKLLRSICRQYAYFAGKFSKLSPPSALSSVFTFDVYRWAVSTVMTRQNVIPSSSSTEEEEKKVHALIPLWDLCNHRQLPRQFSTDFSKETNRVLCFAAKSFTDGSEVTIFYGNRSRQDFFLHNGFVPLDVLVDDESNFMSITLGISKNDPLEGLRRILCDRLNIPSSGKFRLYPRNLGRHDVAAGENSQEISHLSQEDIVTSVHHVMYQQLIAFLRIFNMKEDELVKWTERGDDVVELVTSCLGSMGSLDEGVRHFLRVRCNLLLKSYPSDATMKEWKEEFTTIRRLLQAEKEILVTYA